MCCFKAKPLWTCGFGLGLPKTWRFEAVPLGTSCLARGSEMAAVIRIPLKATIEKVDAAKEITRK
jgi:hypothetical protein